MQRVMLVGETGAGKSSLIRALSGENFISRNAMSVEYCGRFVNTPGAFLENRRFYRALISTSADCGIVLLVQDACRISSLFPPQFVTAFNRKTVGVISKIDASEAKIQRAERFLQNAGVKDIVQVSAAHGEGLDVLRDLLG